MFSYLFIGFSHIQVVRQHPLQLNQFTLLEVVRYTPAKKK